MTDAAVAATASVAVAIITAVVGPTVLARYKGRHAAVAGARAGRPLIPARPGTPRADAKPPSRLRALGLTSLGHRAGDEPAPHVVLREAGPRAVLARLADIPPLSRRAVAEELYVGRWADWGGVVRAIREGNAGYHVDVVDDADGNAAARLDFAAAERPLLEPLREGDRVRYAARVTGAEHGVVTLDSAEITRVG